MVGLLFSIKRILGDIVFHDHTWHQNISDYPTEMVHSQVYAKIGSNQLIYLIPARQPISLTHIIHPNKAKLEIYPLLICQLFAVCTIRLEIKKVEHRYEPEINLILHTGLEILAWYKAYF